MLRLVAIVLALLSALGIEAAQNASLVVDWEGVARGTPTYTSLQNGTHGTNIGWDNLTYTRYTIAADTIATDFPVAVTLSNVTYTSSGTNMLEQDTGGGLSSQYMGLSLGYDSWTNILVCGLVRVSIAVDSESSFDTLTTYGDSSWTVMQFTLSPTVLQVRAHGASNDVSQFDTLTPITLVTNRVYYFTYYVNHAGGQFSMKFFDSTTGWALLGTTSCAITSATTYTLKWFAGYPIAHPGNIRWGNTVVFYDPSAATILAMNSPSGGTPSTSIANIGTLHVGSATWK